MGFGNLSNGLILPFELIASIVVKEDEMANFDQRGQKVTYQFNANGNINFVDIQNKTEFIAELRKLISEVHLASKSGSIQEEVAVDVQAHLQKAIIQAEKEKPDQKTFVDHINGAKTIIEGLSSASGLVSALIQAANFARSFFL